MKKLLAVLVLVSITLTFGCKKNSSKNQTVQPEVYCVYYYDSKGNKHKQGCYATREQVQQVTLQIREDDTKDGSTAVMKSDCSEC